MPTKAELEKKIEQLETEVLRLERAAECCHEECAYFEEELDRARDNEEIIETLTAVLNPDTWGPTTQAAWNRFFPASALFGSSVPDAFRELRRLTLTD